jgi:cytochrome b subunit of formate dehydrogenase
MVVLFVVALAIAGAVIWYFVNNPEALENLAVALAYILGAIVVIAVLLYIAIAVLAIPYYAAKGETTQTNASYDIRDVKSVQEKKLDDEDKDR